MALSLLALLVGCTADSSAVVLLEPPQTDQTGAESPWYDPTRLIDVVVEMDSGDAEELAAQTRDIFEVLGGEDCLAEPFPSPYTWFEADVTLDGIAVDTVGIRKKGFIGSLSEDKPGLKLKFDKHVEGQELDGMERFTLNNSVQDPSLIKQCLGYALFTEAGLPAARCNFAHVSFVGEDLGVYVHVEPMKRDFLDRAFGDSSGDLYEGTLSDFRDEWMGTFEAKTDDTDADKGPILDVITALKASDDTLEEALRQVLDLDQFFDFWATEVLIGHWDGYAGNNNNFYVYRDPADGLIRFLPWGIDGTMYPAGGAPQTLMANSELPRRLYAHHATREQFEDRLRTLLDTAFDEAHLHAEIDRMEALLSPVATQPDVVADAIDEIRSFVDTQRQQILDELADSPLEDKGPRAMPCLVDRGEITMDFAGTWGTLETSDPFTEGEGTLEFTWDDELIGPYSGGTVAGTSDGYGLIAVTAWAEGYELYQNLLFLEPDKVKPGEVALEMWAANQGILIWMDALTMEEGEILAFMTDGTVDFIEADATDGAPLSGTATGTLMSTGL